MLTPYADFLKKSFVIKGRTDRRTYWSAILAWLVILFVLIWFGQKFPVISILPKIFTILMMIPTLTGGVRRLHDIGKSGYWILLAIVPFAGWLALFIYFCLSSASDEELARIQRKKEEKRMRRNLL